MKDFYSFARRSIGVSHIQSKKPCQDYTATYESDDASVIVVSDGHGSSNFTRSDRGSQFACEAAIAAVQEFLRCLDPNDLKNDSLRDGVVTQLCKYILLRWNALVDEDAAGNPFTEAEVEKVSDKYKSRYLKGEAVEHAYGCTLILVILTKDFCLAIRNGDGQCVAVDREGGFTTPIPWNENCEFNVTTSLCDAEAIDEFRYYYSTVLPAAIFAGSDGVDDSYTSVEELYHLYRHICLRALDEGPAAAAEYVERMLPEITRRGSTDDVSIAALLNLSELRNAQTAMEIVVQLRKLQAEEAQRERQKRRLTADIQRAEKKKAKAVAQHQDLVRKMQEIQEDKTSFLEQIFIFRKKADTCGEDLNSLEQEEKQLADFLEETDSEIARLKKELLVLDEQKEADAVESRAPVMAEPAKEAVNGSLDCEDSSEAKPET